MEEIILDVESREELGKSKAKALKRQGIVPAVIYKDGKKATPVKLQQGELLRLIHEHHHRLENIIFNLRLSEDAKKKSHNCLIKEIQYDPVHGNIIHVDFNEISLTKTIKVNVPTVSKGEPAGVKQDGGSLEHILWEITVECLPTEIPQEFSVDVSKLKIGDSIHVKDIVFPAGIKVITDKESVVFSVAEPMKEEEAAPAEGEEMKEPEVIKEKKETAEEEAKEEEKKEEKEKK